ncbi:MAG: rhodanese-like domain-containing protein [Brevinema sp.]
MNNISEKDFLELQSYILLDVRTDEEFSLSHLKNATHIPVDELLEMNNFPFTQDQKIICYCRSGVRSQKAAEFLFNKGYEAYNLGGMTIFSDEFLKKMETK